jgi:hypothetical protein
MSGKNYRKLKVKEKTPSHMDSRSKRKTKDNSNIE